MEDIMVTTPQRLIETVAQEAAEVKRYVLAGEGDVYYFRNLGHSRPKQLQTGSRVYYIEEGYVRGFAVVSMIDYEAGGMICGSSGRRYRHGWYARMDCRSWCWIQPIAHHSFQGWRYVDFHENQISIIGYWLDPKPELYKKDSLFASLLEGNEAGRKEQS